MVAIWWPCYEEWSGVVAALSSLAFKLASLASEYLDVLLANTLVLENA